MRLDVFSVEPDKSPITREIWRLDLCRPAQDSKLLLSTRLGVMAGHQATLGAQGNNHGSTTGPTPQLHPGWLHKPNDRQFCIHLPILKFLQSSPYAVNPRNMAVSFPFFSLCTSAYTRLGRLCGRCPRRPPLSADFIWNC